MQDIFSTFADVKTKGTQSFFNQINTSPAITHIFNIRYTQTFYIALSKIKQEYWLVSNGQRFAIERIENVNEENLILRFYCNIKGEDSVEYSKAR